MTRHFDAVCLTCGHGESDDLGVAENDYGNSRLVARESTNVFSVFNWSRELAESHSVCDGVNTDVR